MSDPELESDLDSASAVTDTEGDVAPMESHVAQELPEGLINEPSQSMTDIRPVDGKMPLSHLQVSVDVCLPSHKVTLSDVSNWMRGALVPLPALPLASGLPIEVRHGTQVLATGSLILLDDCYAVQIDKVMVKGG
jgi:flagellar motor switch/type III secretory pathway protein FliN